jgi:hypothetical protein
MLGEHFLQAACREVFGHLVGWKLHFLSKCSTDWVMALPNASIIYTVPSRHMPAVMENVSA